MYMHTYKHTTGGSVLIITIVITSVLLSIGVTLATILEKEITRQSYGRRSQVAINVANTALECTLFNDFRRSVFRSAALAERVNHTVECGELYEVRADDLTIPDDDWSKEYVASLGDDQVIPGAGIYSFIVIRSDGADLSEPGLQVPCAHVVVTKECVGNDPNDPRVTTCADGLLETSIEVRGYDSCSRGQRESDRGLVRRFRVYY